MHGHPNIKLFKYVSSLKAIHQSFAAMQTMETLLGLISKNECLIFAVIIRVMVSLFARSLLVCLRVKERLGVVLRTRVCLLTV
jgi:hypothetical protein